jgi:hypothetical protein
MLDYAEDPMTPPLDPPVRVIASATVKPSDLRTSSLITLDIQMPANRVAVWSESAGGYLAAMTGVTGDVSGFDIDGNLDQSSKAQAVVDKLGPSDLSKVAADFDARSQQAYGAVDNPVAR